MQRYGEILQGEIPKKGDIYPRKAPLHHARKRSVGKAEHTRLHKSLRSHTALYTPCKKTDMGCKKIHTSSENTETVPAKSISHTQESTPECGQCIRECFLACSAVPQNGLPALFA